MSTIPLCTSSRLSLATALLLVVACPSLAEQVSIRPAARRAVASPASTLPGGPSRAAASPRLVEAADTEAPAGKRALRAALGPVIAGPLAPAPVPATPPGGPFPMSCESLSLVLDAFGGFGLSSGGSDALFDAGSGPAGTVFESMAFVRGVGFLDANSLAMPQAAAGARRAGDAVIADYELGTWRFELRTHLGNCAPGQATLEQDWTITNVGASPEDLAMTLYVDGDLAFHGDETDDRAAVSDEELLLFDDGADPGTASAFLGLSSEAPDAVAVTREVGEFSEQRRRIARGSLVADRLVRASLAPADADGDRVTDSGFDATLAISHELGAVAPGDSRRVTMRLRWGVGALADVLSPPRLDAGPDRVVECEGQAGTLVHLDATSSPSFDRIAEWTWSADGVVVGDGPAVDATFLPGIHELVVEGVDAEGRIATDEAIVEVVDSLPPVIRVGAPVVLWPPDHRLVPVALPVTATDACSPAVRLRPLAVLCDEPSEMGPGGDGRTFADAVILEDGTVLLRRERAGGGDGRVYHVICEATDASGNASRADVRVDVPHDRDTPAVDSGTESSVVF